jgi:hypothetical protein
MKSLFKIVLCELFHPFIFGKDENSDKNIDGHFLVINSYISGNFHSLEDDDDLNDEDDDLNDDEDDLNDDEDDDEIYSEYDDGDDENIQQYNNLNIFEIVEKDINYLKRPGGRRVLPNLNNQLIKHPLIRNYRKIVNQLLRFEIAQCITLSGGEYVAIIKTVWIKIIIRTFKNAFKKIMWKMYSDRLKGLKGSRQPLLRGLLKSYKKLT